MHKYGFVWKYRPPKTIGLSSCSLLNGYTLVGDIPDFRTHPKDVWLVAVMVVIYIVIYPIISHPRFLRSHTSVRASNICHEWRNPPGTALHRARWLLLGMWKLDMEFYGVLSKCGMPRELPFKTRHDDELGEWLPNCETTPEGWSKLGTHSSFPPTSCHGGKQPMGI